MQICTNTRATLKVLKNAVSSQPHVDCLIRPSPSVFVQYAHMYPPRQYVLITPYVPIRAPPILAPSFAPYLYREVALRH